MRELPILMNGPMVRAVLEGRKTVTRRVVKPRPDMVFGDVVGRFTPDDQRLGRLAHSIRCPYGQPGDRLWVRESFAVVGYGGFSQSTKDGYECFETFGLEFAAGGDPVEFHFLNGKPVEGTPDSVNYEMASRMADSVPEGYRPSIHMPRWASRITLEVTSVRVERLCEISNADALAEGINRIHHGDGAYYFSALRDEPDGKNWSDPVFAFQELWESINGAGSWDPNPWVWVVEFRRLEKAHG